MPAAPSSPGSPAEAASADRETALQPYAYASLRVVPRAERGECLNVGVVLFCRPRRFLAVRTEVDADRLRALAPDLDLGALRRRLDLLDRIAAGDPSGGRVALLPMPERFGWLVAPVSTVVRPGPVHPGLTADPAATLDHLLATLVRLPPVGPPPDPPPT